MNILINSQQHKVKESAFLADVLKDFSQSKNIKASFAVALNSQFVAKGNYATTVLNAGDKIDIMSPIAGG
ncbi:thiamine biosynthesis protein ThiS [Pseudoalteromonas sp. NBT06-2]|uniref:sulfur carrier protein ThiS n=1 Tax=Pseudoalteromonas sp. NBT06-2 TaxID=2025950 RepID=UPI000BA59B2E|nr:sulfur carrier protein ThiS [Pseudoalteromonas sp. NBT06-2]PAJ72398.1 thiamine biosynthesis protein ThiS [Pseudoalteromonas sp. NBT06-2]